MSRIISIVIDYDKYEHLPISAFEEALSTAIMSTSFEYVGARTYKRVCGFNESTEQVYQAWLSILVDVYNTLAPNFCVYSSYTCYEYLSPI